jgi:DNA-binding Lrp family transcriptional regulator
MDAVTLPVDLDDPRDRNLLEAVQQGLPLVSRPYAELGRRVGLSEAEVIGKLGRWAEAGLIKRMGVIVRHRRLGYCANAMVVWDVPDERASEIGRRMSAFAFVTLCYRRPRRGSDWPYNLFCMIHGRDRSKVEAQVALLAAACGLADVRRAVLFSRRCFKQRGALYRKAESGEIQLPGGDSGEAGTTHQLP